MAYDIVVIAEHLEGSFTDATFELLGKGREIADSTGARLSAVLLGQDLKKDALQFGICDSILCLDDERLLHFVPERNLCILQKLFQQRTPGFVLIPATSMGLDLASSLSARLNIPMVGSCKEIKKENGSIIIMSQQYGGKISVEIRLETESAILSFLPGIFKKENGIVQKMPQIEELPTELISDGIRIDFQRLIKPEGGDVDITQMPVLVSIGRGIQNKDNLTLAQELADTLGGAVSASRPVVDQGWLPMTRQVGRSGMIVRPKCYFALGISGAPEHIEGMKDAELIIAVNSDPNAPIFHTAHYGVVGDMLDFLPVFTEAVKKKNQ